MTTKKEPLSKERNNEGKNKNKVKRLLVFTMVPFVTLGQSFCTTINELDVYHKMTIDFKEDLEVEYASSFDALDYIEDITLGEISAYSVVDTTKLGKHEVMYLLTKNNIQKEIYTTIEVVDTKEPEINIKEENISIYLGENYEINSNIISVTDNVDGELEYREDDIKEEDRNYYTVSTDFDKDKVGDYQVNIKAIDGQNNISEKSYTISVKRKYSYAYTNRRVNATVDTSSVVAAAYSLLGYNYTYGGTSPQTGFDCTGFVYYIYSLFGKQVGRSSSNVAYSGIGVSPDNMEPGDIIVWSTRSDSYPTHAALYVGDGNMIHAANYNDGVILSSVSNWARWGAHIVAVRRV